MCVRIAWSSAWLETDPSDWTMRTAPSEMGHQTQSKSIARESMQRCTLNKKVTHSSGQREVA